MKKLPSRDIAIQLKEREDKLALSQRSAWLKGVSPSARVIADLYPVLVHGVRIKNVNTIDQGGAIKSLIEQNQSLNPGLTIARVAWPRGVRDTPKLFSSLIVFLCTPK